MFTVNVLAWVVRLSAGVFAFVAMQGVLSSAVDGVPILPSSLRDWRETSSTPSASHWLTGRETFWLY
jgi:hypothetical protein